MSTTQIEADIARTREELAATVDELTARLDVKARLRTSAVVGATLTALTIVALVAWRRRR